MLVDPEIKKEFEERQKQGPFGGAAASPMGGFDMAAWMAGSDASKPSGESKAPAAGGGGGGGRQRRKG